MSLRYTVCALLVLALTGACDPPRPADAGVDDAGAGDAGMEPCESDLGCEDGLFCTTHRCRPGDDAADARGCVDLAASPCLEDATCDEQADSCGGSGCAVPDADGDGHAAVACGGDDCDDFDPARYPTNAEVCDVDGHDEDCLDDTFGGTDADEDGAESSACCNGGRCGPDCDDSDPGRSPTSVESCDGFDEDCDGRVDEEGAEPLCPGGACVAGRCDLGGWDRTYGGTALDLVWDVAMDSRGAIYVVGAFSGVGQFGSELFDSEGAFDSYVVSFDADGTYRWARVFGNGDRAVDSRSIDYDSESNQVFTVVRSNAGGDLGHGVVLDGPGTSLIALQPDGGVAWSRQILDGPPVGDGSRVSAGSGVSVSGSFEGTQDFGGLAALSATGRDAFVARYDADGAPIWRTHMEALGASGSIQPASVATGTAGSVVVGRFSGSTADFGLGARAPFNTVAENLFIVGYDETGVPLWDRVLGQAGDVRATGVAIGERVFVVGRHEEQLDFGSGDPSGFDGPGHNGFLLSLALDGSLDRVRSWSWAGDSQVLDVAVNSASEPLIVGGLEGLADFGTGTRRGPDDLGAFYVAYDRGLEARTDGVFAYPGFPATSCPAGTLCRSLAFGVAVGPADSTVLVGGFLGPIDLGSGVREPRGGSGSFAADGFAVRLPN